MLILNTMYTDKGLRYVCGGCDCSIRVESVLEVLVVPSHFGGDGYEVQRAIAEAQVDGG